MVAEALVIPKREGVSNHTKPPGRSPHQDPFLASERHAQFIQVRVPLGSEFRLSSFKRSGSLELISRGEFEEGTELVRARMVPQRSRMNGLKMVAGDKSIELRDRFEHEIGKPVDATFFENAADGRVMVHHGESSSNGVWLLAGDES